MSFADADVVALHERRSKITSGAGSALLAAGGIVVGAGLPGAPWTTLAGGITAGVGAGLIVAARLRERGDRALRGDAAAVAGFARRAARWSSRRRARVAARLLRKAKRLRDVKIHTVGRTKRLKIEELKLGVLYGLEHHARKHPKKPLIHGDNATVPEVVEGDPRSDVDSPSDEDDGVDWRLVAGGAAVAVVVAVLASKRGK